MMNKHTSEFAAVFEPSLRAESKAIQKEKFIEIPHPNWIEIDLDNLQSNIKYIRSLIPPEIKLFLPVKADAYGHGSLAISFAAVEAGIDFLGVAHLFEGIALRENGVDARVLILGPCTENDFPFLAKYNLTPSIPDFETAKKLSDFFGFGVGASLKVHIQIDTGMHRFGINSADFEQVQKIFDLPNLEVEGIYSHFATADMPTQPQLPRNEHFDGAQDCIDALPLQTKNGGVERLEMHHIMKLQLEKFDKLVKKLESVGKRPPICHIANSPATVLFAKDTHYNMARPGIAIYGYDPLGNIPLNPPAFPIKPVLRLRSTVRALREIEKGEGVSYGHYFVAQKKMKVATVAIGYGDGYMRGEPNKGVIFICNKPCQILGRICMDACMVDVSGVSNVKVGDVAECINGEYSSNISVESFAKEHNTISYEITTRMARRLYRIYRYKNKMLRWDELKNEIANFPRQAQR